MHAGLTQNMIVAEVSVCGFGETGDALNLVVGLILISKVMARYQLWLCSWEEAFLVYMLVMFFKPSAISKYTCQ